MQAPVRLLILTAILLLQATSAANYALVENRPYYNEETRSKDPYLKERCVLDVYYPTTIDRFPTVVWFHGGGLKSGKKEIPEALQNKGIAVVGVNYRLSPKVQVKDCIKDAAAAVSWTFERIAQYGGDPNLVFVSGHSAGGYLTSMVGLDKSYLRARGMDANRIAGLIPLSGHTITHFTERKARGIRKEQPVVDELAPLFHVRKDAPPLLLITGDRELEMLGRYEENAFMFRMMKVAGHKDTRIMELDGYGHAMTEPAFPLLLKEVQRVLKSKR
jgi:acetyl esterase/lipase